MILVIKTLVVIKSSKDSNPFLNQTVKKTPRNKITDHSTFNSLIT